MALKSKAIKVKPGRIVNVRVHYVSHLTANFALRSKLGFCSDHLLVQKARPARHNLLQLIMLYFRLFHNLQLLKHDFYFCIHDSFDNKAD